MRKVLLDSSMTIKSGATRTVDKKAYQTKMDLPMDLPLATKSYLEFGGKTCVPEESPARAVIVATLRRFCDR